jgi:hypothetical protein
MCSFDAAGKCLLLAWLFHIKLLRDGSDAMLIADYVAIGALIAGSSRTNA